MRSVLARRVRGFEPLVLMVARLHEWMAQGKPVALRAQALIEMALLRTGGFDGLLGVTVVELDSDSKHGARHHDRSGITQFRLLA